MNSVAEYVATGAIAVLIAVIVMDWFFGNMATFFKAVVVLIGG